MAKKRNFILLQLRFLMLIFVVYIFGNQYTNLIKYYEHTELWVISGFDIPVHLLYAHELLNSPLAVITPAQNPNLFHFLLTGAHLIELKFQSIYIYVLITALLLTYIIVIAHIINKFLKSYIDSLLIASGLILGNYQFWQSIAEGLYPYLLALLFFLIYLFMFNKSPYRVLLLPLILYTNYSVFPFVLIFEMLTVLVDLVMRQNKSFYNKKYILILVVTLLLGVPKMMGMIEAIYHALSGLYQEAIGTFRPNILELSLFMFNSNYTLLYYICIYVFLIIVSIISKKLYNINYYVYFLLLFILLFVLSGNALARTARLFSLLILLFIFHNFKELFDFSCKRKLVIFYLIIHIYLLPYFVDLLQGNNIVNFYHKLDPDILEFYNSLKITT